MQEVVSGRSPSERAGHGGRNGGVHRNVIDDGVKSRSPLLIGEIVVDDVPK